MIKPNNSSHTYIFLTNSIGGISGGSIYVRNKLMWLKETGWNVIAFDSTGIVYAPVVIEELKPFANNRIRELKFHPSWFTVSKRNKIVRRIYSKISDDNVVIETNNLLLAEWGEIFASKFGFKHLVFVIGEHERISNKSTLEFAVFKSVRMELFSISPEAYRSLHPDFDSIDANNHWWNAKVDAPVCDIQCAYIDRLPYADYTIGHFGRLKPYLINVLQAVDSYAKRNRSKTFNFVLMGTDSLVGHEKYLNARNVNVVIVPRQYPLPLSFFKKCNVVFATAGCARIAFEQGAKVVAMNVKTHLPLGVLGYTTLNTTYGGGTQKEVFSIEYWLEQLLEKNAFSELQPMEFNYSQRAYDYQIQYATFPDGHYFDVIDSGLGAPDNFKDAINKFLVKLNFTKLLSAYRRKRDECNLKGHS